MNLETFSWNNAEGLRLHALNWRVEDPLAVIYVVHGQGEHIGRYFQLANWFNAHHIAVIGFDLQGYGRSEGRRGFAKNYEVLLDDIGQFNGIIRERYPGRAIFLYGHSMGGNLSLNYVIKHKPRKITGHIASSPWIKLPFENPTVNDAASKLIRQYKPTLILPTGLAVHFLSHNQEIVDMYMFDPFVHDKLDARIGMEILEAGNWLDNYTGAYPLPLLLMHGEEDRITDPAASKAFAKRVEGPITFKEWPDMYHELHNELEYQKVLGFVLKWIRKVLE